MRSAYASLYLHAHFTALCVIDDELLAMEFSHCGEIRMFPGTQVFVARILNGPFCSCDLDLDLMTFIYEPDPYSVVEIHRM